MRVKKRMMVCFLLPCILLFSLIYLIPMGIVFVTSFFEWKSGGVFHIIGLRNYIEAFVNDTRMHQALKNTGIWALLQSTVHVGIGTITAFILSRKIKGWKIFRTIFMIPNVISAAALGVIFLNVFNPKYGLLNSMISTITGNEFSKNWYFDQNSAFLTVTWSWLLYAGLVMILVLAGVMSVPDEVMEAAKIDGASGLQIDFKIRLPLVRTILGTCIIISATSMLREFELIYLTTNGGPGDTTLNLPLYLYKTSLTDNNYGYANMMGVLLIILGIFAVFAINKLFRMSESDY
ncbi:binding-protein-dependent transport system inner membrane protein [Lacrimispora sphenoides]|uniref:Raffinose/stachyose/melibiose transport system permease protein n=2 Tax=Lacrimispora sphenoides TaxID=29370 RepID=A0ABY1C6N6_9FIRM|nr:raffinose/stachyose/melibiose transport system permease protein [[Clostridium] sphenoides JCM 1415]SUY50907.1 binding-protein-dependent transport system inner membrane protein [Lacrimispora sphenoides]